MRGGEKQVVMKQEEGEGDVCSWEASAAFSFLNSFQLENHWVCPINEWVMKARAGFTIFLGFQVMLGMGGLRAPDVSDAQYDTCALRNDIMEFSARISISILGSTPCWLGAKS